MHDRTSNSHDISVLMLNHVEDKNIDYDTAGSGKDHILRPASCSDKIWGLISSEMQERIFKMQTKKIIIAIFVFHKCSTLFSMG